ncbi:hypothetical protein ACFSE1_16520 [Rhizobium helianthi]|uniref:Transmembrane protein n=1 Tax=Rhizobium helianthi TaxID=1132695 RepID=A0ABW4M6K2_9HYPH
MFLDDEQSTVKIRNRQRSASFLVAGTVFFAVILTTFAIVGTASASELPGISQMVTPQLLLAEPADSHTRLIYGGFIALCSVAAAGFWRVSFRMPPQDAAVKPAKSRAC